jgi:hypothetical protein
MPDRIVLVEDKPAEMILFRLALDQRDQKYDRHEICDGAAALQYIDEYRKTWIEEPERCVTDLDMVTTATRSGETK